MKGQWVALEVKCAYVHYYSDSFGTQLDTRPRAHKGHKRCTRGAQEVQVRGTSGAPEGNERCTYGH